MSTLETQYKNYLKENPESAFTFEEWSDWKFSNMELPPPHNGLRPIDEHAEELSDWDVTLMDGLENEPYVSDDFQIGPDGAYEHIEYSIPIIDEAYENFVNMVETNRPDGYIRPVISKEEFIFESKVNTEFSEKWGLKIEERELDMFERWELANLTPNMSEIDYCNKLCDEHNVPTKLITITYKDTKIESYE